MIQKNLARLTCSLHVTYKKTFNLRRAEHKNLNKEQKN